MNKFIKALFAIVFLAGLTSCLKDTDYDENKTGNNLSSVPKIIELATLVNPPYHDQSLSFDFKDEDITVTVLTVRLAAAEPATEDITVTIDTSHTETLLTEYNNTNGQDIVKMPDAIFTFVGGGLSVVIPKGARSANLEIKTNTSKFDPSSTYGFGFTIGSIDKPGYVASGNFGEYVTTLGAKNKYDGSYLVSGTLVDVLNDAFGPWLPSFHADLVTAGGSTCALVDQEYSGGVYHPFFNAGSPSYYGAFGVVVSFDPATDKVTSVVSPYVPAANTRYAELDATYDSYFDPVTHDVTIKYYMYQPSLVAVGPRVTFVEKWTYQGPR